MPNQTKSSVAKDVFAYLLLFVVFYMGVIDFISLLWHIIGVQFPDPTAYGWIDPYEAMRSSISTLIVVWPVFLFMSRYLVGDLKQHPEKAEMWVRKWLMYLTIFVASITIIIDLVMLINSFLGGELTARFALKLIVLLVVAAAVLRFEFWELKRKPDEGKKELRSMAVASVAAVILSIVGGFYFIGTPASSRQNEFDSERISDLQNLQGQIVSYWDHKDVLPGTLDLLKDPISGFSVPLDPQTDAPYSYAIKGELTFELCAIFSREMPKWERTRERPEYMMYDQFGNKITDNWTHGAGKTCFERTIDPERHKTTKTVL